MFSKIPILSSSFIISNLVSKTEDLIKLVHTTVGDASMEIKLL